MSRTQIGYALEYKNPAHAILVVHQRHKERLDKFSVEVRSSQFETPFNGVGKDKKHFFTKKEEYMLFVDIQTKRLQKSLMIGYMKLFRLSERTVITYLLKKTANGLESVMNLSKQGDMKQIRLNYS